MKKIVIFIVFCMAMLWSYNAMAQNQGADNRQEAFVQVTIPYTWADCSRNGTITVKHTWSTGDSEEKTIGYKPYDPPEGKTYSIPMTDFGGTITQQVIWVKSADNGDTNEYKGSYKREHIMAPGPCSANHNECKRIPGDMIQCNQNGGGNTGG